MEIIIERIITYLDKRDDIEYSVAIDITNGQEFSDIEEVMYNKEMDIEDIVIIDAYTKQVE